MDDETKAAFADVSAALGSINAVLADVIAGMATKAQLEDLMARMNDGFERVLEKQHNLQVVNDTHARRITRLEDDMRDKRP